MVKMDKEYNLSFCIPVYNNSHITEMLVNQILTNKDGRFQVVISDDCSTDDTIKRLEKIKDNRLKVVTNSYRKGAKSNWCNALKSGDGEYLYLVMGRDRLNSEKISELLDLIMKCDDVPLLEDRKCNDRKCIISGVDALKYFLKPGHPTGIIIKKSEFNRIDNVEALFMSDMAYPEILLKAELMKNALAGAIVDSGVFTYQVNINKSVIVSEFEHNKDELYFFPSRRVEEFLTIISIIDNDERIDNTEADVLYEFFLTEVLLREVSYEFKSVLENYEDASHYRLQKRYVSKAEMIENIVYAGQAIVQNDSIVSEERKRLATLCVKHFIDQINKRQGLGYSDYRKDCVIRLLRKLMYNKNQGRGIVDALMKMEIQTVAIYGWATVGQVLYDELKSSEIRVIYAIDKNWDSLYSEIPIVCLDKNIPDVDLIIISLVDTIDTVVEDIKQTKKRVRIVSAEELIYRL